MDSELTRPFNFNEKPAIEELSKLITLFGSDLPADYLAFIGQHNGAEGDIGQTYLTIWPIQDVAEVTQFHRTNQTPYRQFIIIGSTGYFHYGVRHCVFYELDLIDDSHYIEMGSSFSTFLTLLKDHE